MKKEYKLFNDGEYWYMEQYDTENNYLEHAVMGNSEADCCRQMFGWNI